MSLSTLNHPLEQKMASVTRRVRGLEWLRGGAGFVAIAATAVMAGGAADYLLRFRDVGLRILVSLAIAVAWSWAVRRFLAPAWNRAADPVVLARRVERLYPDLREGLASSLEFLRSDPADRRAGSPDLRQLVIAKTTAVAAPLDFTRVIDATRPTRVAMVAGAVLVVLATVSILAPATASLALQRMLAPWRDLPWPRRNHLEVAEAPRRLAAGSDLEVVVVDANGRPPDTVRIWYWFDGDDTSRIESFTMKPRGDQRVHRRESVMRSLRFRVEGGDDDTLSWQDVAVIEPPRLESVTLRVVPPAYTLWPTEAVTPPARVLVDSKIELSADVTYPVVSARLTRAAESKPVSIPLAVTDDGRRIRLNADAPTPWRVKKSGTYLLEVDCGDGLRAEVARWVIDAVVDQPPTVTLQEPAAESVAVPRAQLALRGVAKDDIRVASLALRYRRADQPDSAFQTKDLERLQREVTPTTRAEAGHRHPIDLTWELPGEPDFSAGTALEFQVVATDALGQVGQTDLRRILLVSEAELLEQWSRRQSGLVALFQEALRRQRAARQQVRAVELAYEATKGLGRPEMEQLQSVELEQRQIQRALGDEPGGVQALLADLLRDVAANQVAAPELKQRLERMRDVARQLASEPLPAIQRSLFAAIKELRSFNLPDAPPRENRSAEAPTRRGSPADAFANAREAATQQEIVILELERLLAEQAPWDNYRHISRDLSRLRQEQETLIGQTAAQLAASAARGAAAPTARDAAEARRLAERQLELARQLDKLLTEMERLGDSWKDADPAAAQTLSETLSAASRNAASGMLHEAGRSLQQARLGQATNQQRQGLAALDELLDRLANRPAESKDPRAQRENEARRQAAQWEQAIVGLLERQTQIVAGLEALVAEHLRTQKPLDGVQQARRGELAGQERELTTEGSQQLATLPPLPALAFALRGAVDSLEAAAELLGGKDPLAEAQRPARDAARRLEQILVALRDEPPADEQPPEKTPDSPPDSTGTPQSSMVRSRAELVLLRNLQIDLRQRTAALETERDAGGGLTPTQRRELQSLVREQGRLAELVVKLIHDDNQADQELPKTDVPRSTNP